MVCAQAVNKAINDIVNERAPVSRRHAAVALASERLKEAETHVGILVLES